MNNVASRSSPSASASPLQQNEDATPSLVPILCAASGLLAWLLLIPFLGPCDQGEQLARFFSALFNVMLIGVGGGMATLRSFAGFAQARRSIRNGNSSAWIARIVAIIAIAIGAVVSIAYLPAAFGILH